MPFFCQFLTSHFYQVYNFPFFIRCILPFFVSDYLFIEIMLDFLSTLDYLMFSTRLLFPFLSTFDFPLYYFNKCSHYLVYNFAFFIRCILPFFVSDHFFAISDQCRFCPGTKTTLVQ